MTSVLRRVAATAATAVAATSLLVPLTSAPASAAVSDQTSFLVVDTDRDGTYGLYTMPTPTGSQTPVAGVDSPLRDVFDLTAARTGGRVAYVLDTYSSVSATTPSSEQVVVRDQGGQLVRVVASISPSTGALFSPALSPDGNTVVWNQVSALGVVLRRADVGTGATSTVSTSVADVVYAGSGTLFGFNTSTGNAVALPAVGGAQTPINIPTDASQISVAPALNYVAWTLDRSTPSTTVADVQWATLDLSTPTPTVGAATTLATGQNNHSPAWDVQNSHVDYVHDNGIGGEGDVKDVDPLNPPGTVPNTVPTPGLDEQEIDIVQNGDAIPPGAATTAPATLAGTSAVIRFGLPADTDLSGVILKRSLGATLQKSVYVPAPLTGYLDTGLVVGSTYSYTFTSVDRSGNLAATAATRTLTAVAAQPSFRDPTSITATRPPFLVRFAANTPANVHYTVDYRVGNSTFTRWVTDTAGAYRTFGSAASTGVAATTSIVGATYTFKASATDGFGNSTPVVTSARGVVPYDQSKATLYGGRTTGLTSTWLGSVYLLRSTVGYARLSLAGDRFQIIGERCPTCGVLDVYDGTTRVATIDTRASTRIVRSVLYTRTYATVGPHTLTIKSRGTAGRPNIFLDAFGVRT